MAVGYVDSMIRSTHPMTDKVFVAEERIERLLMGVTQALDAANIPYAVIGGNAIATWVATVDEGLVRNTKGVDLMLRREDLGRAAAAVLPIGLLADSVGDCPIFLDQADPRPSRGVHVVVASEVIGRQDRRRAPDLGDRVRSERGFWVLDLPSLLYMKLHANRLHDKAHVGDLLQLGLITRDIARTLPRELFERLLKIRDEIEWPGPPPALE